MGNATKRQLADALKARLEKSRLENITIKDITGDCGLNRQTFYYHFKDIYDLTEWIFEDEIHRLMEESLQEENIKGVMIRLSEHYKKNEKTILHACKSMDRTLLHKFLRKWMTPIFEKLVHEKTAGKNIDEADIKFIVDFCTIANVGIAFEAMENDMLDEIGTQADRLSILLDGSLDDIIGRFCK